MHVIAAKAVSFLEALQPSFTDYAKQIVKNAKQLGESLKAQGIELVSGGTDNHLLLLDLTGLNLTGKVAEKALDDVGVTTNKNAIPFDPESPFVTSGIRIGTAAVTSRGFKEEDMVEIAEIIGLVLNNIENEDKLSEAKGRVHALTKRFPMYE